MFWKLNLVSRRHKMKPLDRNTKVPRLYFTNCASREMWLFWAALSAQPIFPAQHTPWWCKGYMMQCSLRWQQCHCTVTVPCWPHGPADPVWPHIRILRFSTSLGATQSQNFPERKSMCATQYSICGSCHGFCTCHSGRFGFPLYEKVK